MNSVRNCLNCKHLKIDPKDLALIRLVPGTERPISCTHYSHYVRSPANIEWLKRHCSKQEPK